MIPRGRARYRPISPANIPLDEPCYVFTVSELLPVAWPRERLWLADYRHPSVGQQTVGADHCCWWDSGVTDTDGLGKGFPVRPARVKLLLRPSGPWSTSRFRAALSPRRGVPQVVSLPLGLGAPNITLPPQSPATVYLSRSSAALCSWPGV